MVYTPADIPPELITILALCDPDDADRIIVTFQFSAAAHSGQHRDEGTPFIEHPVAVASILWHELGLRDADVLLAALMHDVLEDCSWISREAVEDLIGGRAAGMVHQVSKRPVAASERAARDAEYLDSLSSLPLESRILKLADRIHNLRCVPLANDPDKARRYLEVSRERFYPLALITDPAAARLIAEACDAIESYLAMRE
jgi:GTP diphosphokinase / guanosine-3',5'-bis(diphosphate) 3'-diphosphatase